MELDSFELLELLESRTVYLTHQLKISSTRSQLDQIEKIQDVLDKLKNKLRSEEEFN